MENTENKWEKNSVETHIDVVAIKKDDILAY